ncbi:hypothetical protein L210DRAFT_3642297 [Boletus edulis BED1]|uniref:Uncharacterized protein n=1 Tax=Boletus edulis BED1 TaxID=1328754 RepID=A0AAD4GIK1_BOLED|nr:hypothetical protein L210DRAFT_3642297 [Boletus edulis BED1]
MSENTSQPILNPNVYLNYLQPTDASEYEIARDIFLVTFGALLWDILTSLPDDLTIIRSTTPSPVLLAYFSSRTCALAVVFMSALAKTGPVPKCGVLELILFIFWVVASASSSYLFLKRVHAVFPQERHVRHAFTVLWIVGVGASVVVVLPGPLHIYYEIANTKHCMNAQVKSYVSAAFIGPVLFDSLVYFAISFKILKFHQTTKPTGWKVFCRAKQSLPHLSRAVLRGGQQYYSITNSFNITALVWASSRSVSPVLQSLPFVPAVALTSAMACRVFRNLKLEALQKTEIANLTAIRFVDRERVNDHLPKNTGASTPTDIDSEQC